MIKDERKNKTELYIIVENSCSEGYEEMQTYIFDNEETAQNRFESLIADDKAFLEEEEDVHEWRELQNTSDWVYFLHIY